MRSSRSVRNKEIRKGIQGIYGQPELIVQGGLMSLSNVTVSDVQSEIQTFAGTNSHPIAMPNLTPPAIAIAPASPI